MTLREKIRRYGLIAFLTAGVILAIFYLPWRFYVDRMNSSVVLALQERVVNIDFLLMGKDVLFVHEVAEITSNAKVLIPVATKTSTLEAIVRKGVEKGKKIGILEFYENEKKLKEIARKYPISSFIRAHLVKPEEYARYDLFSLNQRLIRAVRERSVDLIILPPPPEGWKQSYQQLAFNAYYSLIKEGANYSTFPTFHVVKPPALLKLLAWTGILGIYASVNIGYIIVGALLIPLGNWGYSISIILATLFLYRALKDSRWYLRYLSYVLLALLANAVFSSPEYIGGIMEFRGVKLSLIALPALVGLKALLKERPRKFKRSDLILFSAFFIAAGYYLLRSGNYGFAPTIELKIRDLMDAVFFARPRTKELAGFASALLMDLQPSLRSARWGFILEVIAAVGMVSIVNTFCHFKGPLFVHLVRTFNGLWMSGITVFLITGVWSLWTGKSD